MTAVSQIKSLVVSKRFENQPIPFMQNFIYQFYKTSRSSRAIHVNIDKVASSMSNVTKKMPSFCEKDMDVVIKAEHNLLLLITIYQRQKAMGPVPLFAVPYYPPQFSSTSLILRSIINYRNKMQCFLSTRAMSELTPSHTHRVFLTNHLTFEMFAGHLPWFCKCLRRVSDTSVLLKDTKSCNNVSFVVRVDDVDIHVRTWLLGTTFEGRRRVLGGLERVPLPIDHVKSDIRSGDFYNKSYIHLSVCTEMY